MGSNVAQQNPNATDKLTTTYRLDKKNTIIDQKPLFFGG